MTRTMSWLVAGVMLAASGCQNSDTRRDAVLDGGAFSAGDEPDVPNMFTVDMTRPKIPAGAFAGLYTPEALEGHVEGMIVKCRVYADGSLRDCHAIKGLPHLQAAVLHRLEAVRATPATLGGRAVTVDYVFDLRFSMPP